MEWFPEPFILYLFNFKRFFSDFIKYNEITFLSFQFISNLVCYAFFTMEFQIININNNYKFSKNVNKNIS